MTAYSERRPKERGSWPVPQARRPPEPTRRKESQGQAIRDTDRFASQTSPEDPLREVIKAVFPMRGVVPIAVYVPDVRNVVFLQVGMHTLADPDQTVPLAAGKPQQFEIGPGGCGGGHEFACGPGVGRRGEGTDPGKRIEVPQPEVQRLATAHRKTCQRAMLAVRLHHVASFNRGNHVLQQVPLENSEGRRRREDVPFGTVVHLRGRWA